MNISKLNAEEMAVVEWQYRMCGGFKSALWDAIKRADIGNLERLREGFPVEVDGFMMFSQQPGWWDEVQRKLQGEQPAESGGH